ncbi:hypothetical protein HOH87_05530 [bacterium]|jgi:hypothetical protein|nr:hypothetical protein [bacterium]
MTDDLQAKIEAISSQTHMLTDEALAAKERYDHQVLGDFRPEDIEDQLARNMSEIDLFNDNVKVLLSVFQKSQFDEFLVLLAHPQRLLTVNFVIGFFRGAGFFLGFLFILFLLTYFLRDTVFLGALVRLLLNA